MKKKTLLSLATLMTASTFAAVTFLSTSGFKALKGTAGDGDTTISFNGSDLMEGVVVGQTEYNYSSKDVTLKTDQLENDVVFHREDTRCYNFTGTYYFDFKGTTGSLYNVTEIRSMVSLQAQVAGTFLVEWGWEVDGSGNPIYKRNTTMYGSNYTTTCYFNYEYPNYFKLTIQGETHRQMTNFVITMDEGCHHTDDPFVSKDGLLFRRFGPGYECVGFEGASVANLVIPDQVNGLDVIRIGECAFYEDETITSLTLPNKLEVVDLQAFDGCIHIESLSIPKSVVNIYRSAFRDLHACTSLTFEAGGTSLLSLGQGCFEDIGHVGTLTLPSRISNFSNDTFESLYGVTEYALNSDNVTGNVASVVDGILFSNQYGDKYLEAYPCASTVRTSYTIPSDVTKVRYGAGLGDAESLVTLNVAPADGVTIYFDGYSAVSMDNLEHLNFGGDGTIILDWFCFRYAPKLRDIVIPENVIVYQAGLSQIADDSSNPLHVHLVASAIPSSWSTGWDYGEIDLGRIVVDYNYGA